MKLYKFSESFGRMGTLEGLFVEDEKNIDEAMGKRIYLGEVLGKHSEIEIELSFRNLKKVDLCESCVEELRKKFGHTISGTNPLSYMEED